MSLHQLVYISRATQPFSNEQLTELLTNAKSNNASQDITGNLIYNGGMFLQVLEGDKPKNIQTIKDIIDAIDEDKLVDGMSPPVKLLKEFSTIR